VQGIMGLAAVSAIASGAFKGKDMGEGTPATVMPR